MPIIKPGDLATNIYQEIIDEITRADDTITSRSIAAAVNEAKMYLGRYDLNLLFGKGDGDPAIDDEYLKSLVKDIACWHLLRLSNPAIDHAAYRTAYQDAIASLKSIMNGQAQPQGWPYADTSDNDPLPDGNSISWDSNPRRENYY